MPKQPQSSIFDDMPLPPPPSWWRTTILGTIWISQLIYVLFFLVTASTEIIDHGIDIFYSVAMLVAIAQAVIWVVSLVRRKALAFVFAAMQFFVVIIVILASFVVTWNRDGVLIPSLILLGFAIADLVLIATPVALRFYNIPKPAHLSTKYALAFAIAVAAVGLLWALSYIS